VRIADGLDRARLYWIDDELTTIIAHAGTDLPTPVVDRDLVPADDGLLVWTRPVVAGSRVVPFPDEQVGVVARPSMRPSFAVPATIWRRP
jgi:hypothetical protein